MNTHVLLVDELDNVIGTAEKLAAHQNGGQLHRAFSLLIFNTKGEILIQKRAASKYHCPGLWTNTCCSHPDGEHLIEDNARTRLQEEMGMECGEISREFSFIYRKEFDNGLTEHELDHVLIAVSDEVPVLNPSEADDFTYVSLETLYKDLDENPAKYTFWFHVICADERFKEIMKRFI